MAEQYPECEKMRKVQPFSQKCGEFIDWLSEEKGIILTKLDKAGEFWTQIGSTEELLAEFFGIDLKVVEQEKRAMLELIREQNDRGRIQPDSRSL